MNTPGALLDARGRLTEELRDLLPEYREGEVRARIRGLGRILKG